MGIQSPPANSMEDSIKQSFNCNENCLRSSQLLSFASFGELFILHNRDWDSNWGRPFLHSAAPSRLCKKAVLIIKIFTFSVGNIRKNSTTIVSLSQSLGAGEYEANEDLQQKDALWASYLKVSEGWCFLILHLNTKVQWKLTRCTPFFTLNFSLNHRRLLLSKILQKKNFY